jgi:hypothetical protein
MVRHSRHLFRFQDCFVNPIYVDEMISNEESNEDTALCFLVAVCLSVDNSVLPFGVSDGNINSFQKCTSHSR